MKTVNVENFVMEYIKECCKQLIENSIEDFNDK